MIITSSENTKLHHDKWKTEFHYQVQASKPCSLIENVGYAKKDVEMVANKSHTNS